MHLGFVIYGSLTTLTGGYIYDRILVEHLQNRGHRVDIISLPLRNYRRHLLDNWSPALRADLAAGPYDLLLQDELNHPSLFHINRSLRKKPRLPIVAVVHQVLCRQPRNILLNRIYQAIEKRYLESVDALIFNSDTTRRTVAALVDDRRPSIVASPAGNRLGQLPSIDLIGSRARENGPLRLIYVGNLLPQKGLLPLIKGLSHLAHEIWHLTVVGSLKMDARYTRAIKRLIARRKLSRQIADSRPQRWQSIGKPTPSKPCIRHAVFPRGVWDGIFGSHGIWHARGGIFKRCAKGIRQTGTKRFFNRTWMILNRSTHVSMAYITTANACSK